MKRTKILVTGLSGFIGSRFRQLSKHKYSLTGFPHDRKKSVTDRKFVFDLIGNSNADVVLHLAAKTHIDRCEADRTLGEKGNTWLVNVFGTDNIALACAKYNKHLIFLSTECVFDGKNNWYKETDESNPVNWYGETKLKGEEAVKKSGAKYCILRSTLAYGHPRQFPFDLFNFFLAKFKRGKEVRAVSDQQLSITFIDDLIKALTVLIDNRAIGTYHYAGKDSISPYQFAYNIAKKLKTPQLVKPISLIEYFGNNSKLRLKNATLSSSKIKKEFNLDPSDLHKAIGTILKKI